MKIETINQQKNPFLKREELTIKIENDTTPSFDELKKQIGKNEDLTVIKKINTSFGKKIFIAEALIYDNQEAKNKIETIPKKIRKKMKADEKAKQESGEKAKAKVEAEAKTEKPKEEQEDNA